MLVVIQNVLETAELQQMRSLLARASFEPGELTGGAVARRVKQNLQVAADSETGRALAGIVVGALQRNALFRSATLYERTTQPLINRYAPGMAYGAHVDNAFMGNSVRSDVAATLFLSDPADYDGGELSVEDAFGPRTLKLPAGSLVAYPASSVHRVQLVTRGDRDAAIVWLQSLVRAPERRRLLFDLDVTINALRTRDPDAPEIVRLNATYHNLLREWAGA